MRRPPARRCTAHSKHTGTRCGRASIAGGTVCKFHGGAAPQVAEKARERLALLTTPALKALSDLLRPGTRAAVRLGAARDVLDRNGMRPVEKIEVSNARQELEGLTNAELAQSAVDLANAFIAIDSTERTRRTRAIETDDEE